MKEARAAVGEALRLNPQYVDTWALLGQVELLDRRWHEALAAAEKGLALDPEHVGSANVRATALRQLGRAREADQAVLATLASEPEDATAHVTAGWQRLHAGDVANAGEHFREALRLDPGNEAARGGLLEALKAGNRFYRGMLRYALWMSKQSRRTIWGVLILMWLVPRFLRVVAQKNPALQPLLIPLIVACVLFVYLTWITDPLFEIALLWHPLGRHVLDSEQKLRARAVCTCLGLGLLALMGALAWTPLLLVAGAFLSFVIPLSAALGVENQRYRRIALGLLATLGCFLLGALIAFALSLGEGRTGWFVVAAGMAGLYVLGLGIMTILANKWGLDPRTQ
jgi:hypothetical protein